MNVDSRRECQLLFVFCYVDVFLKFQYFLSQMLKFYLKLFVRPDVEHFLFLCPHLIFPSVKYGVFKTLFEILVLFLGDLFSGCQLFHIQLSYLNRVNLSSFFLLLELVCLIPALFSGLFALGARPACLCQSPVWSFIHI